MNRVNYSTFDMQWIVPGVGKFDTKEQATAAAEESRRLRHAESERLRIEKIRATKQQQRLERYQNGQGRKIVTCVNIRADLKEKIMRIALKSGVSVSSLIEKSIEGMEE